MLTTRTLPPAEWARLAGTSVEWLLPQINPEAAWVEMIVVERDGLIVGACALMTVLHPECFWTHPAQRGSGVVATKLFAAIQDRARAAHQPAVAASSVSAEMHDLLLHLGATKLPGDHFVLPITKGH